jgi:DUF1009 family protein
MRITLLAGSGALVPAAVTAALEAGHKVQVLSLTPRDDVAGAKVILADVENPLKILWSLKVFRTTHVVMAGAISLSDRTRESLARFARSQGGGETGNGGTGSGARSEQSMGDGMLSHLATVLERMTGARVIGVHEIAPGLLAPEGLIAGPEVTPRTREGAAFALRGAREAGRLDLGQAVVATGQRMIAVEDVAGTDALLRRVGEHRAAGLTGDGADPLILAKAPKPGQPEFMDLPAVGPDTIANAAAAGITVIAVEAGGTLLIERAVLAAAADRAGVTVIGLRADG